VGKNGQGKTTLARVITGELEYTGKLKLGHMVTIGYYAQNQADLLDGGKTVFETLDHIARGDARKNVRNILGSFLFSGDDIDKKVNVLSGGERSRLALAALLLEPVNLLVLDEPTNHLDIRSKDILKRALKQFDGTMILVSHDRDFLHGLTDTIYEFKDKNIRQSFDDIDQFLKKKKLDGLDQLNQKKAKASAKSGTTNNKQRYEEDKKRKREREKMARRISASEKEIEGLEAEIGELNELFAQNADAVKDAEKFNRWEELKYKLDKEMERWEKLHAELEDFDRRAN
jgi:ATP-binding cassette subfamily F protein 3